MEKYKEIFDNLKQNFDSLKNLQNQLINQIPMDKDNTQKFLVETMTELDQMMLKKDFNGLNNLLKNVTNHASNNNK